MKHAGPMEIEIKVRIPSAESLERSLAEAGFGQVHPRALETSVLWDRAGELQGQESALRLRRYGAAATLTWKGKRLADPLLKIRPEVETAVADAGAMEGILRALGYLPIQAMAKQRSVWARGELEACVDEAPFGCFVELEGRREAIAEAMGQLGLQAKDVETRSYSSLFQQP
jgi:adenylate cyclase class 2